ncbi:MAG: flagellar hook-length control protein FliK [Vulcanimicrobiaceae bacterium]
MNTNLLNLFSTTGQTAGSKSLASTSPLRSSGSPAANLGDMMFGQLLTAQLQNTGTAPPLANGATSNLSSQALAQLKTTIEQMLQAGVSVQQIANQLAQTLGSSLISQLQLAGQSPGQNVNGSLVKMIAQALGPPGNGPPQTIADGLVQRFEQVANALAKIGANATGQQQDSLGTISDAKAGDTPAPNNIAAVAQAALVALQQSAHPFAGTSQPATPPAPWVPTASSNSNAATLAAAASTNNGGPTVATNPSLSLVGTGADTVIGRILARAANVAANQSPSAQNAPSPQSAQPGTASTQNAPTLQPQIAVSAASNATNGAMNDALAASLLRTVQNALATLPQQKPDSSANSDSAVTATANINTSNASIFSSLGLAPVVNTTFGATPAGPPPQSVATNTPAQVDPNAVVEQVLQGISMRNLSDGSQSVRMRLVPESLGSVTVNLSIQGSSVNATLLAQNTDVRDVLLANQQALARSLSDAGLRLASFTVNLANNGHFQQQQQAYQQQRFGTIRRFFGNSSTSDEGAVSAVVPTYGPPSTQLAALQWLNALA